MSNKRNTTNGFFSFGRVHSVTILHARTDTRPSLVEPLERFVVLLVDILYPCPDVFRAPMEYADLFHFPFDFLQQGLFRFAILATVTVILVRGPFPPSEVAWLRKPADQDGVRWFARVATVVIVPWSV